MTAFTTGNPALAPDELAALAAQHFGLTGTIRPLPSERDQNARLTADGQDYVLKIANAAEDPGQIDLQNATIEGALTSLSTATRNFYRVTSQRTVTIIPDTPAKRTEYEDEVVRTFYLSNADVKETLDLLRIVIDNRRLAPISATNALSIKDTPERVDAAARLIAAIDKARPEVVVDVELLEDRIADQAMNLAEVRRGCLAFAESEVGARDRK